MLSSSDYIFVTASFLFMSALVVQLMSALVLNLLGNHHFIIWYNKKYNICFSIMFALMQHNFNLPILSYEYAIQMYFGFGTPHLDIARMDYFLLPVYFFKYKF